jgi:hypothetical protein
MDFEKLKDLKMQEQERYTEVRKTKKPASSSTLNIRERKFRDCGAKVVIINLSANK